MTVEDHTVIDTTHEHTINTALGEVLSQLRGSWRLRSERTGRVLVEGGRPDILIEEASGWPVVIEAEKDDYAEAEKDAKDRLNSTVASTGRSIETAIALVYPEQLDGLDGPTLRNAIRGASDFEFALYTYSQTGPPIRLPLDGWLVGGIRDLAMLVHRAAVPPPRVDALASDLEDGVRQAANEFTHSHSNGSELGTRIAGILGQDDDVAGQTRRMAMTVLANALVFHESLAEVEFMVTDLGMNTNRGVLPVDSFRPSGLFAPGEIVLEWERILSENYWPIFWSAKEILRLMPTATAHRVLNRLWQTGQRLVTGGVTRSHDLTGLVFQRLIADRKFLATYYTRPEAAALLAALALPVNKPPGGADWSDAETLAGAQIGDFACGTGTLLSTAYQRMSLLHELHGGNPRELHSPMMRYGLVGLDVLNIAVHLTAAMLASSHPDTPFDGECLLTVPFGKQDDNGVAIGSLDLLSNNLQPSFMETAAAVSAGGRAPEIVRDLVNRVGHGRFDLVIMNPPFVRSTGMEAEKRGSGNPAFAAFNTEKRIQKKMQVSLANVRGSAPIGTGNAGLAADFLDLALRKARPDGVIALVLPLSAVSGLDWERARIAIREYCRDICVVTIAGAKTYDSSFSADTGMAECLLVARKGNEMNGNRATFVMLRRGPSSAVEAELLANEVSRLRTSGNLRFVERMDGDSTIAIGRQILGAMLDAPLPSAGPWPFVGIIDEELAQVAWNLERGSLTTLGQPDAPSFTVPMVPIHDIAGRGPYHADINWDQPDGTPRGPFELVKPPISHAPTYPILWAHDNKRERMMVVEPDSEGRIKSATGKITQPALQKKAANVWSTASRAHYNRDLRFNSQSTIVAMTEHPCIGGRAWPSVVFDDAKHECAFALWSNSTLGVLLHWWVANKTQSGRGTTTVTGIPNIRTFDVRKLSPEQLNAAYIAFRKSRHLRLLPFDQIDEDPARAELDKRLLVDVLGLPETLCEPGGTIDLLRRKLANEPQVHGGKKSRVVFLETVGEDGETLITETNARRSDR